MNFVSPGEHALAQLADHGNAIVMCAWRSPDQAVKVTLEDENGSARDFRDRGRLTGKTGI